MSYGVTDDGWITKTLQTIVDEFADDAEDTWGEEVATTPDSVTGQLFTIIAAALKDVWDLGSAVEDTQNRDAAEGDYLDYLAALIGLSRLSASGSTGDLLFTGSQSAVVDAYTACKDSLSRVVLTDEELELNRASCYQSTFSVNTVSDSTDYTLTVEGDTYTYTSDSDATETEILEGLETILSGADDFTAEVSDSTIIVTLDSYNNTLTTTNSSNLTLDSVGSLVSGTAATTGELTFEADTVTTLVTSNLDIDSVTNPEDFEEGREEETDEELRLRMSEREQSTGTATKPAIEASLSEVDGVTAVLLDENTTMVESDSGVPAKSFEVYVVGGDEDDIAEVIWETKPAGIATYGTVTKIITDDNGDEQTVYFSRKTDLYAWVEVTYEINSEEDFPSDAETLIQEAVVTTGDDMYDGEDFNYTKFYGQIYSDVSGINVTGIRIATTEESTDTPTYQTDIISIAETENLNFDTTRVEVTS